MSDEQESTTAAKVLSRADILGADDRPTKRIHIPEWGGDVIIRTITARERDQFEQSLFVQKGNDIIRNADNMRSKLCSLVLVDEEGKNLFSFDEAAKLGQKSAAIIARLFDEAQKLNGITKEDREEMIKNSESVPSEDSTSV